MSQKKGMKIDTPLCTPIQSRSHLHMVNSSYTPFSKSPQKEAEEQKSFDMDTHIFGTNIHVNKTLASIEHFLMKFQMAMIQKEEISTRKIYRDQLEEIETNEKSLITIDGHHLFQSNKQLYMQLIYFPIEIITCFDDVLRDVYEKYYIEPETDDLTRKRKSEAKSKIMMNIKNLKKEDEIKIKDLSVNHLGKMVSVSGIIIRASQIYPEMKVATFICDQCSQFTNVQVQQGKVQQPKRCLNRQCNQPNSFILEHNRSVFTNKQYIKFQQNPQSISQGGSPSSVTVIAYDNNIDGFRPGDKVQIIGIYRATSVPIDHDRGKMKTVFNTYIDMISYNVVEEQEQRVSERISDFSEQEKIKFIKMAQSPTIRADLARSFAPSICGHENIKKGLLAQLFGGTKKIFEKNGRGRFRSDINICLLGDPSTAKSQLLQQVHKIATRSIYTSGRGSSAVGLTASVRKDPDTKEFVLESGALVLSDQGICCIDQFDKVDENARTILLEAMEQQTISIAKAGIVCQLNSRTSVLVAANPIQSKYNPQKSLIENINLQPALLSRFDLIYILLDIANESSDKILAAHILNLYVRTSSAIQNHGIYSMEQIARYISFSRKHIHPIIPEKEGKQIGDIYCDMRKIGLSSKTISATPRQLQSLIRLSEAFAKMRLSNRVESEDVQEALMVIQEALLKSAVDPSSGMVDMEAIVTGRSRTTKNQEEQLAKQIREIIDANKSVFSKPNSIEKIEESLKLFPNINSQKLNRQSVINALKILQTDNFIVVFGQNKNKPYFKLHKNTDL